MQISWRQAFWLSIPALVIVWAVLLPFCGKAFTIDDTFYLREAQQALHTPLTPTATLLSWDGAGITDEYVPLSAPAPVGPGIAYVMLPAAAGGMDERLVHITQLVLFSVTILAT